MALNTDYSVLRELRETTVKVLKIWIPEKFAVLILTFEQNGSTIE